MAVLFGSTARGSARAESDVDIGVKLERGRDLPLRERFDLALELERLLGREVDLVILDEGTALLRAEAAAGRYIFEHRRGAFADFFARALFELDDMRPHLLGTGRALLRGPNEAR